MCPPSSFMSQVQLSCVKFMFRLDLTKTKFLDQIQSQNVTESQSPIKLVGVAQQILWICGPLKHGKTKRIWSLGQLVESSKNSLLIPGSQNSKACSKQFELSPISSIFTVLLQLTQNQNFVTPTSMLEPDHLSSTDCT